MALHLWVDARAGVAGDMLLGALVDAGAGLDAVQAAVDAVLPGTVRLRAEQVTRAGMRATKVSVDVLEKDQPTRHWSEIRQRIQDAALPSTVRSRAIAVFALLARAEARVHGVEPEEVHFHEVGAWDSIADVVGVCAALESLKVWDLSGGPAALGSGLVSTGHGAMSVPVPAVLEIARDWRVTSDGPSGTTSGELATPTGMALLVGLSQACGELPPMVIQATGVGAGQKEFPGHANVVRVVLGERTPDPGGVPAGTSAATMTVLSANVDDLDPRVWPSVLDQLIGAGAADAWLTPILMKKGRPAHTLSVLVGPGQREPVRQLMFRLTTTIGVRECDVSRTALRREWVTVVVHGLPVRIKIASDGDEVLQVMPEFEDVVACAESLGLPQAQVLQVANAAAEAAGLRCQGSPAVSSVSGEAAITGPVGRTTRERTGSS